MKAKVAVLMGSDSDLELMLEAKKILDEFGIDCDMQALSAHRSPDLVIRFAKSAQKKGIKVIIAGAGGAAHLAGVIASNTILPVIGVPISTPTMGGLDSLLSTVQMPGGIPVATVAVGKGGAINAGLLAIQILALNNPKLAAKLWGYKSSLVKSVQKKNESLRLKTHQLKNR